MERDFFKKNLDKLKKEIKDGEMIILTSGKEITFSCDTTYRFRANKNFYYYLGYNFDNVTYVLEKEGGKLKQFIFFDEVTPERVKWIGSKLTKDKVKINHGLDDSEILTPDDLVVTLERELTKGKFNKVYLSISKDADDMSYRDN
ncbi:MAG: aminopeptidase P N-terminal domain-containing protein [Clostridia bacterium]|nr:aminopeptidase P N-terminal domain-containing protein [Clostridia bacterium]